MYIISPICEKIKMRRSLGNGGGRGGMGGGSGGTMRTFQRAIRAGGIGAASPNTTTTTPISAAKKGKDKNFHKQQPTSPLTLHSSSNSSAPFPPLLSAPSAAAWLSSSSSTICSDESEWEYVDGIEDETAARGLYEDCVFGTVPSSDEVHHAVSALQKALGSSSYVSSPKSKLADITSKEIAVNTINFDERMISSEIDWLEPSQNFYNSKMLQQNPRSDMVYDAFYLLETEPSVQRMVVSLSSDKAVWDAVLNNDVVKELRGSIDRVSKGSNKGSDDPNGDENILSWIVMFAKGKMMQLLDLITTLMNNVFVAPANQENEGEGVDGKVKSSFFLSLVVLLVVILARTKNKDA